MAHRCNLQSTRVKLPPLRPIPDVHMFDELPIKLQPRYNQRKEKHKKIQKLLEERAMTIKKKMARRRIIDSEFDFVLFPQDKYIGDLRKSVSEIVPTPMIRCCELKILRFIPKKLKAKFPKVLSEFMDECKQEWKNCLHDLAVDMTIKNEKRIHITISPFKFAGKTENYPNFLKAKSLLKDRLMILNPLMRYIKESSVKILPESILDFSKYTSKTVVSIQDLTSMIHKDIKTAERLIVSSWYPQIIIWLKESKKTAKLLPKRKLKLLKTSSNFIAAEITELMRRSINYLILKTEDEKLMPTLNISLHCDLDIVLKPNFSDICTLFHMTIDSISGICQNMEKLEVVYNLINENKIINIHLSEWINKESHDKIQHNLEIIYSPIQEYANFLNVQYSILLSPKINFEKITDGKIFDDRSREVKEFKSIREKVLEMLDNEYFTLALLNQVTLLHQLRDKADHCENLILDMLCEFHIKLNEGICTEFEIMASKITAIPNNPSELMESGAYCNRVKTILVDELRGRICESILTMSKLIEITSLSDEHISLNTKTVNWLTDIEPLIDQNAITFENCKYEMEENLIQKTNVLMSKIADIVPHLEILDDMDDINNTLEYLEDIQRLVLWLNDCDDHVALINNEEAVFKFPLSQYVELDELKGYILPFYNLMHLLHKWRRCYSKWMDGPFEHINNIGVELQHEDYCKQFTAISKNYKNKIKQQISDGVERRFKGLVEDPDPMNLPAPMKLCAQALNELKDFQPNVKLINIMCNPALRRRHWDEMSLIAKQDLTPNAGTTIRKIIALDIWDELDKYEIISIGACKELALKTELDDMINEWDDILFKIEEKIIVDFEIIQEIVHNHWVKTISMQGSAFVKPFIKQVDEWYTKLKYINQTISFWRLTQEKWQYYLPFFSITENSLQMGDTSKTFYRVNDVMEKYIHIAVSEKKIINVAGDIRSFKELKSAYDLIEKINFEVQKHLDLKRYYFPRLYFLSNMEVFQLLSESSDITKLQKFIHRLFNGVHQLEYDENDSIIGILSDKNEKVKFLHPVSPFSFKGYTEKWLEILKENIKLSLQNEIKGCSIEYSLCDVEKWQQMVSACVFQLWFTEKVETALCLMDGLDYVLSKIRLHLSNLFVIIRDPKSNNLIRLKVSNLITILQYAENITSSFIKQKISNTTSFNWMIQFRYFIENNNIYVKMMNIKLKYGYEYVGNTDNFVITPMTERCYRTLLKAYQQHFNGLLEGPAGTGKTESIKYLANMLALQCVIFNCAYDLNADIICRLLTGVANCGAWICFDEINRTNVEVLSVMGQHISSISQAKRENISKFTLNNREVLLNPMCFICFTLNPGYIGRSELPYNLKSLFRTISMTSPDILQIAEVFLYSNGYYEFKKLSLKIVTVHDMCSKLLTLCNHYDFKLRSIKSVLLISILHKLRCRGNESQIVLEALRAVIKPKLILSDVEYFEEILSDVFFEEKKHSPNTPESIDIYRIIAKELNLHLDCELTSKIQQIQEMIGIYHGIILLGDPYSGKTSILKLLTKFYDNEVEFEFINPNIYSCLKLFGQINFQSKEWEDGLISKYFRRYATDQSKSKKWLIFDGPIEPDWVENMNTVFDDSKRLCLSSGEIIFMNNSMTIFFEVTDLNRASPATVSRCAVVCLKSSYIGIKGFVRSWINTCNVKWINGYENMVENFSTLLFPVALSYVKNNCKQHLPHNEMNLIFTCLNLFGMIMNDAVENEDDNKFFKTWIQATFTLSLIWGVGGLLDIQSKEKFDDYMKSYLRDENNFSDLADKIEVTIPAEGTLYDYVYQYKQKGSFKMWQDYVKSSKIIEKDDIKEIVIPTLETVKSNYLLELHIKYKNPLIFIGPAGIGKNFYVKEFLKNQIQNNKCIFSLASFTTSTTVNETRRAILSRLVKKGNEYNSPRKVISLVYIDDLNLLSKDNSGVQTSIEFLRQCIDHKYFFDEENDMKPMIINDNLVFGTMAPEDGIRNSICSRLLKQFNIFSINYFSEDTIYKIFSNVLQIAMKRNGFGNDAAPSIYAIVSGTWHIFQYIKDNFRPVCDNYHYIFSLKDIFRVIQGCSLIKKESADNKKALNRLWIHEVLRVLCDRLVDVDHNSLLNKIEYCTKEFFKDNLNDVCEHYKDEKGSITLQSLSDLMFGTYLDMDAENNERKYEEIVNIEKLQTKALETLQLYNAQEKFKLNIVFFKSAIKHLSKICRILSIPGENGLLIGHNGSGKKSLIKIGSLMLGLKVFQPHITDDYNVDKWESELKTILKVSGGIGNDSVLILDEILLQNDTYIKYIDKLLNCGEVPDLFKLNEQQEILEMVRLDAQGGNRNSDISPEQVFLYFVNRYRRKMHTFMCINPVGKVFLQTLQKYPTITQSCTINWFEDWPEEALESVAHYFLEDVNLPADIKSSCIKRSVEFYKDTLTIIKNHSNSHGLIKTHITSNSYISMLKSFSIITTRKQDELRIAKEKYMSGLEKLELAAEAVSAMQQELNELKPQLIIMAVKGTEMMEEIEHETIEAAKATKQVREDEKIANEQAAGAQALKKDCEADLALAIPILEDAIAALNTLKPTDITVVKSMKNPPAAIKLVMAAVCVMKSILPDKIPDPNNPGRKMYDFWGPSKRLLGDMSFLQNLKEYDKDNIPPTIMAKIRKEYLPHKDFKPQVIAKASTAAEGLCKWVIAMDMYDAVAKVVAPKKTKLQAAELEFATTMQILQEKKAMVARLEKKVADLHAALEEANLKKQQLEDEVEACINKLHRAEKLIGGLGGEKSRWMNAAENLQLLYDSLAGDILLSSAIINYLSTFPTTIREPTVLSWRSIIQTSGIPNYEKFSFSKVLATATKIQSWRLAGLPNDKMSVENAVIQESSIKWSLLVDPQGQANKWIKELEKENDLVLTSLNDSNYLEKLQNCITNGLPILIENVQETLNPSLDSILKKQIYVESNKEFILLNDEPIEYNKDFRLYMTTKLKCPVYTPDVFDKVTVINFALTITGLSDQLLKIITAKERPDMEELREKVISERSTYKAELKALETSILNTLHESEGDILEDEEAIEVLDSSKTLSGDILKKQIAIKDTELLIEEFRQNYEAFAHHSAILFYSITELANINPMYEFSLNWFIQLFIKSIDSANKSKNLERRLCFLKNTFMLNLHKNVCRGIFLKDRLLFSFIFCCKILLSEKKISYEEFNHLLKIQDESETENESPVHWISNKSWNKIQSIEKLEGFHKFSNNIIENIEYWEDVFKANDPFIKITDGSFSDFQKLLIINIIRPDKFLQSIEIFVKENLGDDYVNPVDFQLIDFYRDSNCLIPMIIVSSPNFDALALLTKFSVKMGYKNKFHTLSLGQHQEIFIEELINRNQSDGGWVCLQNCNLSLSWIPILEKIYENIDLSKVDRGFRLWLISNPTVNFPQSILQLGIKITKESPRTIKGDLREYYNYGVKEDRIFFEGCPGRDKIYSKFLYCLRFFHAVIRERKTYGSLGWNVNYNFNNRDFAVSLLQMQDFINNYKIIPLEMIKYFTGECFYGGKVTNDWDRRLLNALLNDLINEKIISDENFTLSQIDGKYRYTLPNRYECEDYINHIILLPSNTHPEVLGLSFNVQYTCKLEEHHGFIKSLHKLHGKVEKSYLFNFKIDSIIKIVTEIRASLPETLSDNDNNLLCKFYKGEILQFNRLIDNIKQSLCNILKFLDGTRCLMPDIEDNIIALLSQKVPEAWIQSISFQFINLSTFINHLHKVKQQLSSLKNNTNEFWLPGFFNPSGLIIFLMQEHARRQNVRITNLGFECKINDNKSAVVIKGLYINCATWNNQSGVIDEVDSNTLSHEMPDIGLNFVAKENINLSNKYNCPLYRTRHGSKFHKNIDFNFVTSFLLPTAKPSSHWIKRSAALLLHPPE